MINNKSFIADHLAGHHCILSHFSMNNEQTSHWAVTPCPSYKPQSLLCDCKTRHCVSVFLLSRCASGSSSSCCPETRALFLALLLRQHMTPPHVTSFKQDGGHVSLFPASSAYKILSFVPNTSLNYMNPVLHLHSPTLWAVSTDTCAMRAEALRSNMENDTMGPLTWLESLRSSHCFRIFLVILINCDMKTALGSKLLTEILTIFSNRDT